MITIRRVPASGCRLQSGLPNLMKGRWRYGRVARRALLLLPPCPRNKVSNPLHFQSQRMTRKHSQVIEKHLELSTTYRIWLWYQSDQANCSRTGRLSIRMKNTCSGPKANAVFHEELVVDFVRDSKQSVRNRRVIALHNTCGQWNPTINKLELR